MSSAYPEPVTGVATTLSKGDQAMATGLAMSSNDELVIVGRAETIAGPVSWGWTARISADGALLWDRDWMALGKGSALFGCVPSANGSVVAVGEVGPLAGDEGIHPVGLLMKVDSRGSLEWRRRLDLGPFTQITAIAGDGHGGAVLGSGVKSQTTTATFLTTATAAGEIQDSTEIDPDGDLVLHIRRVAEDGYLIVGSELVRVDREGRRLWRQPGLYRDAVVLDDGSVIAIAMPRGQPREVVRFDPRGERSWARPIKDGTVCEAPVGIWAMGRDSILVLSHFCPYSDMVLLTFYSGAGGARGERRVRIGEGVQVLAGYLDAAGRLAMAGLENWKKAWVFRARVSVEPPVR